MREIINFERGIDPKAAMGLGMRERIKRMMKEDNWKYYSDDDALQWASDYGHKNVVEFLLKVGADVHIWNDAPLQWASRGGHKDIVEILIKAGANVRAEGDYALRCALERGHIDVVKLLKKWI